MSEPHRETIDIEALAGEYVLGLLDPAAAAELEARMETEPALKAAVGRARERFLEIDLSARPAPVPHDMWERISRELDAKPATTGADNVVSLDARRRNSARAGASSGFWRGFAAAAAAAAVLAVAGIGTWSRLVGPAQPQLIVVLLDQQAQPAAIVEALAGDTVRVTPLGNIAVPAGRAIEVWTLPDPQRGPVSLGLLNGARLTTLKGRPLPPPRPDQLYEITLEPATGSPTGRPTGPILGKGFAKVPSI
jgi:anti-sigma-K factor RskA